MHNLIIVTLKIYLINTAISSFLTCLKEHAIMWIADNILDQFNVKSGIAMVEV